MNGANGAGGAGGANAKAQDFEALHEVPAADVCVVVLVTAGCQSMRFIAVWSFDFIARDIFRVHPRALKPRKIRINS